MADEIKFTIENDEGEEIEHSLPAKMEVCSRCEGHGFHLTPSIGEHAYTMEEFRDSFDDEEAEQYFKRGGIYDVVCEECHGKNVVPIVNEEACTNEQKEVLKLYHAKLEDDYNYERECREERRMGC